MGLHEYFILQFTEQQQTKLQKDTKNTNSVSKKREKL